MSLDPPANSKELRTALEELIKLQAHYAKLLNLWDGGQRWQFSSADEWIERLRYLARTRRGVPGVDKR